MPYSIFPLGDSALTVSFGNVISREISSKVWLLTQAIEAARLAAVKDIVPAYSSVTVHYDTAAILKQHNNKSAFTVVSDQIKSLLTQPAEAVAENLRHVRIPACYSSEYGLDLKDMSEQTKLPVEEIIRLHTTVTYHVYMIGFLPGFAYMGDVDERIAVGRKPEPRQKIEAGYVGIAGRQTGIYPLASPGGWQIIGRTPVKLFDKEKENPVFFKAGDEVTFYSISADEFDNY